MFLPTISTTELSQGLALRSERVLEILYFKHPKLWILRYENKIIKSKFSWIMNALAYYLNLSTKGLNIIDYLI